MQPSEYKPFDTLPDEQLAHIMGFLDPISWSRCQRVNTRFRALSNDHTVCHAIIRQRFHSTHAYSSNFVPNLKNLCRAHLLRLAELTNSPQRVGASNHKTLQPRCLFLARHYKDRCHTMSSHNLSKSCTRNQSLSTGDDVLPKPSRYPTKC
ncbi:MAG: F-box protein [Chlamydiia bacterium]|nr:F-box protein [Chlamydiia bacterium]